MSDCLYTTKKEIAHRIKALNLKYGNEYFVPSMSTRTVVYKGLLLADQVGMHLFADPQPGGHQRDADLGAAKAHDLDVGGECGRPRWV